MVGGAGIGLTVTAVGADGGLTQPSTVSIRVKEPVAYTVMEGVTALVLHILPEGEDDVRITLSPWQKVVGPDGVIVGAGGVGLSTTVVVPNSTHPPAVVAVTEYAVVAVGLTRSVLSVAVPALHV